MDWHTEIREKGIGSKSNFLLHFKHSSKSNLGLILVYIEHFAGYFSELFLIIIYEICFILSEYWVVV